MKNIFKSFVVMFALLSAGSAQAWCGAACGGEATPNCGPAPRCEKVETVLVTREAIPVCGWQCPADCVRA